MIFRARPLWRAPMALLRQRARLVGAAGWVLFGFFATQILRLVNNVVLARLLAPELMGTMVLINSLRTGGELLTDVGVGQSIIKDSMGGSPEFYTTAWTIQIIRGIGLFVISCILTIPIAYIYDKPNLLYLLPVCSMIFLITAVASPAPHLLQKKMNLRKLTVFSLCTGSSSLIIHIMFAIIWPNIWALVGGLLVSGAVSSAFTFTLLPDLKYKINIDIESSKKILHFGKWVFASSLIYFASMNFDRLYFAAVIPLSLLGVYGIARTFSEALTLLFQRLGYSVVFPTVSASALRGRDLRDAILPVRRLTIVGLSIGLAAAVALSDALIHLLYDSRYEAAAVFLPLMLLGAWFSLLATLSDSIMMGIGRPSDVALANGVKLAIVVALVPALLGRWGMVGALCVFALAEAVRYAVLVGRKRVHGLSFVLQDVGGTVAFLLLAVAFRELTAYLGVTGGIASWLAQAEALNV